MDAGTSKGFFDWMINRGYEEQNARQIIARHNTYKATQSDKATMREYLKSLQESGTASTGAGVETEPVATNWQPVGNQTATKEPTKGEQKKMARTEKAKKETKTERINVSFTKSNYDYIVCMAKVCGMSAATFVNEITTKSRENNAEAYERAKNFRLELK